MQKRTSLNCNKYLSKLRKILLPTVTGRELAPNWGSVRCVVSHLQQTGTVRCECGVRPPNIDNYCAAYVHLT